MSQSTLDHHLDVLQANSLIKKQGANTNAPYQITQRTRADWGEIEELLEQKEKASPPVMGLFVVCTGQKV